MGRGAGTDRIFTTASTSARGCRVAAARVCQLWLMSTAGQGGGRGGGGEEIVRGEEVVRGQLLQILVVPSPYRPAAPPPPPPPPPNMRPGGSTGRGAPGPPMVVSRLKACARVLSAGWAGARYGGGTASPSTCNWEHGDAKSRMHLWQRGHITRTGSTSTSTSTTHVGVLHHQVLATAREPDRSHVTQRGV